MTTSIMNPFITDAPVDPGNFFGRKDLVSAAVRFLEQSQHKMMFVNGPRCIGKSSLLRKLKHELTQRGFVPVVIDLEGKAQEPMPQVLFDMMTAINAENKLASGLSIGDFQDDFRVFESKFLPSISQSLGKMILLFDEFDVPGNRDLVREDPAFGESAYLKLFPYLHSLIDHTAALKCIVACGRSLSDMREYYEPVKAFSLCEQLEGFIIPETTELVATLAAGAVSFTPGAIEEIQRLTKGYPHFVQCLASGAFDFAEEQNLKEIDRPEIEGVLSAVAKKYGASISSAVRDILPQERAYLILIAKLRERGQMATEKAIFHEFKQLGMDATQADIMRDTAGLLDLKILEFNRNFMAYSFFAAILEKWFNHEYTVKSVPVEMNKDDRRFDDALRTAKIRYNEKNFDKAAILFRLLTERYSQRFEPHYGLALALESGGKSHQSEVIAAFEKAYRFDPDRSRRAYKTVLKRAYEKDSASPVLEKLVDLGDSTIEDRKKLLTSYFELWRKEITEGHFDRFLTALKNKPWLLKEYQTEIIRFIDDLINDIVQVNPYIAGEFVSSIKDYVDGVQHHIWQVRIEGRLKKANNMTTEIHSLPPELLRMKNAVIDEVKQADKKPSDDKKQIPIKLLVAISLGLLLVTGGLTYFIRSSTMRKPARQAAYVSPERLAQDLEMKRLAESILKPDTVPVKTIAPAPSQPLVNEPPVKNEARIMLINASAMYQKGLSAKARDKLVKNGFPSQNVLTGNNRDKVSRVYAYYSAKQYAPVLKEALAVLYPGKEPGFFDISSKDRTVNGWIKNFFKDEKLHILIRMPNEE